MMLMFAVADGASGCATRRAARTNPLRPPTTRRARSSAVVDRPACDQLATAATGWPAPPLSPAPRSALHHAATSARASRAPVLHARKEPTARDTPHLP